MNLIYDEHTDSDALYFNRNSLAKKGIPEGKNLQFTLNQICR